MPTVGKAAGAGDGDGRTMQQAASGTSHRLREWVAPDAAEHVLRGRALLSRAFSDGEMDDQVVSASTALGALPTTLAALSSTPRSGVDSGEYVAVPPAPATAPHGGRVDVDDWDEDKTGADDVPKLSMVDRLRKRGRVESVNFDHQHHVSRARGHTGHNLGFRGFRAMANHGRLYPLERVIRKYGLHERASSSPDLVAEVRGILEWVGSYWNQGVRVDERMLGRRPGDHEHIPRHSTARPAHRRGQVLALRLDGPRVSCAGAGYAQGECCANPRRDGDVISDALGAAGIEAGGANRSLVLRGWPALSTFSADEQRYHGESSRRRDRRRDARAFV